VKPFPPFGEENLWRLIGNLHRFPDPENDAPTQDRSVQLFLDYYRLPSFQGLTCGWLKTYHDLVFTVTQFDPGLRDLYQSKQEAIFSQHVKRLADKALGLFTASFEETLENVIAWQDEERNQSSWSQADEDLFFQHTWSVFALGNYHPERTSRGARVPYVQKNGLQFGFLELDPNTFPVSCPPAQYWPRMGLSITPRWVGEMVGASDVPVSTKQDPRFPQAHSVEQTLEQADKLLNAAYDDKRRVIPTGAIVQLKFGLFHSFEVHEVRHEIGFVARTHTGEFSLLYFQHEEGKWKFWWPSGFAFDGKATQSNSPVVAALKHVLAAAVHDFWTLDERTFAEIFVPQNPKKVPGLRNRKTPEGAPGLSTFHKSFIPANLTSNIAKNPWNSPRAPATALHNTYAKVQAAQKRRFYWRLSTAWQSLRATPSSSPIGEDTRRIDPPSIAAAPRLNASIPCKALRSPTLPLAASFSSI
jgi:hypothetical protein